MVAERRVFEPDQTVQNVEVLFEAGEFLVEECGDTEAADYVDEAEERYFCILENHKQQPRHIIHSLTIFNFRIEQSIRSQHVPQLFWINTWHLVFGAAHI